MLIRSPRSIWTVTVVLTLITETRCIELVHRPKRNVRDHFDLLLNLYKVNPLRHSKIFKEFSNRMLVPNTGVKELDVMHFDTNESTRERLVRTKVNLKQIEEAIHVTQPHKELGPPSYTVSDVVPETFSAELTLEYFNKHKLQVNAKEDFFDNVLGHIASNETLDKNISITDTGNVTKGYYNSKAFKENVVNETTSEKYFNNVIAVDVKNEKNTIKYTDADVIVF